MLSVCGTDGTQSCLAAAAELKPATARHPMHDFIFCAHSRKHFSNGLGQNSVYRNQHAYISDLT